MTVSSSVFSRLSAPTLVASVPLMIWARDNLIGLVRVQGPSMEPTLQQGDVLMVRKADAGVLPRLVCSLFVGEDENDTQGDSSSSSGRSSHMLNPPPAAIGSHGSGEPLFARLYDRPPRVRTGQVVVLKSVDTAFPEEWHIKRVWGTAGSWVQIENGKIQRGYPTSSSSSSSSSSGDSSSSRNRRVYRRLQGIPPHALYVGGDNEDCSRDSRHYGPVSQNLLVGVAEYVVWPPWRMQKIATDAPSSRSVPLETRSKDSS